MERATGFEPATASLEGWNSTTELRPPSFTRAECPGLRTERRDKISHPIQYSDLSTQSSALLGSGGQARIRTLEADGNRFTVCPLCPLGYLPIKNAIFLPGECSRSRNTDYVSDDSSDQQTTKIPASAERTVPLTVRTRRRSGILGRDGFN